MRTLIPVSAILLPCVLFSPNYHYDYSYFGALTYGPTTLRGEIDHSDLAQDVWGFRALILGLDPYPILFDMAPHLGIEWRAYHQSTHPPTAFLLVAPVAFLPWPYASATWGWLMIAAAATSLYLIGITWKWAIITSFLLLLWPPMIFSLGQLTPLWMLGIALAFRDREKNSFRAGVWIGIASLSKFFPAVLLIPFLIRKKWNTLWGFLLTWFIALIIVVFLAPDVLSRYIDVNHLNAWANIEREDNGNLFIVALRYMGLPGFGGAIVFFLAIIGVNWRTFSSSKDISGEEWALYNYLSIIILPVVWSYSVLPLLLTFFITRWKQKWLLYIINTLFLIVPAFIYPLKVTSPPMVTWITVTVGLTWLLSPFFRYYDEVLSKSFKYLFSRTKTI